MIPSLQIFTAIIDPNYAEIHQSEEENEKMSFWVFYTERIRHIVRVYLILLAEHLEKHEVLCLLTVSGTNGFRDPVGRL